MTADRGLIHEVARVASGAVPATTLRLAGHISATIAGEGQRNDNEERDIQMTMITLPGSGVGGDGAKNGAVRVCETYWGYEIREKADRFDRETLAELFLKFLGVVCVLAAYGHWFLPESLAGSETLTMKAALSVGLGAAGLWLCWYANRGLATGTEIDLARREIRVVRRNGRGRRWTERAFPMARVETAALEPGRVHAGTARLHLHLRAPDAVLHLATGAERDIATLHARVISDLRPMRDRIDDRLAETTPFQSRRSA